MNLRQRNFFLIKNIYNFFLEDKTKIYLFVHVNNLNTIESNWINFFCKEKNIIDLNVKLSLYKKMIKNNSFMNIVSGPSKIFQFSDFDSFLTFFEFIYLKKKLIPLAVYWNSNFYSYKYFSTYLINNLKNNNNFIKELHLMKNTLLSKIVTPSAKLVTTFNYNNLFLILNLLLKKKN